MRESGVNNTWTNYSIFGDLKFPNRLSLNVKKGEIIGYTQDTGVKMFGNYNVVFRITRYNPETKTFFTPEEALKEYSPSAYSKSTVK